MKICMLMATGFEESEAIIAIDLFRRAGITVDLYGVDKATLKTSHGLIISELTPLAKIPESDYDLLYLPGGKKNFEILNENIEVQKLITYFFYNKKVAAICAAPAILGNMGLLKDRKYTCYTGFNSEQFGGTYQNQYFVTDGNLYTGRSMAATLDFSLMIIESLLGKETANKIKDEIIY